MANVGRTPKRAVQNPVIEIDSSPALEPRGRTRSASRTIANSSHGNGKKKGKGNASSQPNNVVGKRIFGPVIELTDSESETVPAVKSSHHEKKRQQIHVQAGPSRHKPVPVNVGSSNSTLLTTVSACASLENIPIASSSSSRKRKEREAAPLFLPVQSDEENEPPFQDVNPGSSQNEANHREQRMDALANDWDRERWPSPLQHDRDQNRQASFALAEHGPIPATALVPEPQQPNTSNSVAPNDHTQDMNPVETIPEPERDPTSEAVAQVLGIIPDVEPDYVLGLVITHLPNFAAQTPEHVLGLLFEGGYPKIDKKGKRKAADSVGENENGDGLPNKRVKVDYGAVDRPFIGGLMYEELALVQLQISFPFIPKVYLRRSLQENRGLYAPTHLAISDMENRYHNTALGHRPYSMKATRYHAKKDLNKYRAVVDEAFAEERHWLIEHLQDPNETSAKTVGALIAGTATDGKGKEKALELEDEPLEDGTGIECQCCFSEYAFDKMVQCPETHLFCSSCVSQYAATKLGEHDPSIVCMHPSGCAQPFPASELRRVLSTKLMELYERVKQQKEIQAASLEGLEECPFCEWKCVIETPVEQEKLFRCGNEDGGCGEVSCRLCKKKDHLPKNCKEAEEDKFLDGRHAIEEAMTQALMRNCPKCNKAFVKEAGCNKMTCPNCRTLSCYICRKVINGYEHFNQAQPGRATTSKSGGKCLLWDNVEERHATEVKAAAEKAAADYKRDHPDVDDKDIKVDIPAVPKPAPQPALQPPQVQWNQAPMPIHFGLLNPNPFLPDPPLLGVARQRRFPARDRVGQIVPAVEVEPRYVPYPRRIEEERWEYPARMGHQPGQEQEIQRQEAIRLQGNQRYFNQNHYPEHDRVEQERLLEAQLGDVREQPRQLQLVQQEVFPNVHVHGEAQVRVQPHRALRAVAPVPPVAGRRRTRRG